MKVLAVSSPHGYTTRDVWMRCLAGLKANGIDVRAFDLLPRWGAFEAMIGLARKKGLRLPPGFSEQTLAYEPILGAALYHGCDTVLVVSPQYMPLEIPKLWRKAGLTTVAYFTECPYEDTLNAPVMAAGFDYVFVNDRYSVTLFESFARRVFYLPHSYDPQLHFDDGRARADNVVFVGTGYESRVRFLNAVDWKGLGLELYGIWWMPKRHRLRQYQRGELTENADAAELYRSAGTGIANHRTMRYVNHDLAIDDGEAYSVGPRTFELAACGAFQVSDRRKELTDIFGGSVPIYETSQTLRAIIMHARREPAWRDALAREQHDAVQGHTCHARMKYLAEQIAA